MLSYVSNQLCKRKGGGGYIRAYGTTQAFHTPSGALTKILFSTEGPDASA